MSRAIAVAAVTLVAVGCGGTTEPDVDVSASFASAPAEVTLRYGQETHVGGGVVRVWFGGNVEDSRCPLNVECVWAGNAKVQIGVAAGSGPTEAVTLNTFLDPRYADWHGVRITLLDVKPQPLAGVTVKPEDYSVTLRFEVMR